MVANQVTVQRDAIAQASSQLDAAHSTVVGLRSQLQSHQAELQGQWKGQASSAFTNVFEAFNGDLGKVLAAMDMLHQHMTSTHTTYNAQEQQQTATVNKVMNALNG